MKRPTDSDAQPKGGGIFSSSKRLRLAVGGFSASTFVKGSAPTKLAKSTLSFCEPEAARLPFTFGPALKQPAVNSCAPRQYSGSGGKTTIEFGVLEELGKDRLARAFQRPFGGVALQSAIRKDPDPEHCEVTNYDVDVPIITAAQETDKPSVLHQTGKRIRTLFSDFPILRWALLWRDIFLHEVIRLDGRADALDLTHCPECREERTPDHRCEDCRGATLCEDCMKHWHKYNPLHKMEACTARLSHDRDPVLTQGLQRFNGNFYEQIRAADLGMRIQLMHPPGEACSFRSLHQVEDFTIMHTNGIHNIPVDFCGCERGADVPHHIQLMRSRLWPATSVNPQTATTHEALDQFTRLSLLGRLNVYDYYKTLVAATDGANLRGIADVRHQLSNCVRQFRHVFMFKRSGRGHEPGGIAATPLGACAVRCPACPDFDMNVPLDWATSPFRWLYRVILSLDANFRLNNKLTRSTDRTDPNLTDGCAYMAPRLDYFAYLQKTEEDGVEAPSDCSRFGALVLANMKGGKGMRTTGIAGCFCARHEFVQPLGLAVLKKGERYSTMDWVFCGALSFMRCAEVTVCYDIACQWSKRLYERVAKIAPDRKIFPGVAQFMKHYADKTITYAVPKFHLCAHRLYCQLRYALSLLFGTGITDGEGCERVWSGANPAASSLREMGPGGMSDTMDDMCSSWNWRKVCGISDLLRERMDRALSEGAVQTGIFTEFTEALEAEDAARVAEARKAIRTWEQDPVKKESTPCPYHVDKSALSVAEIKLQAEQAQGLVTISMDMDADEETTLTQFLLRGLQVEEDRARFCAKHAGNGGTVKQVTAKTQALNAIAREILSFRKDQEHHMPSVYAALTLDERDPDRKAALTVKLHMPSDPPEKDVSLVPAASRMVEARLRWASMIDELDNLRHQLRLRGCLNKFKLANITGQHNNTRARGAQDAVNANVKRAADAYRRHRKAYFVLVGPGEWEKTMRDLDDSDCRGLGDRLLEQMQEMSEYNVQQFLAGKRGAESSGETRYELPWIWFNRSEESGLQITDELMVEWCKSRARAQHWVQEVRLLDEEMRRVIEFSENMGKIWDTRREPKEVMDLGENHAYAVDKGWADGVRSYACKQAWIRRSQASRWRAEFTEYRMSAQRFLTLHTSEGLSIEPLEMLSPVETGKMMVPVGRSKPKKPAAPQLAGVNTRDPAPQALMTRSNESEPAPRSGAPNRHKRKHVKRAHKYKNGSVIIMA